MAASVLIAQVLHTYLGGYLHGLSGDNLNISFADGNIEVRR